MIIGHSSKSDRHQLVAISAGRAISIETLNNARMNKRAMATVALLLDQPRLRRIRPSTISNDFFFENPLGRCNQISCTVSRAFRYEMLLKWSGSHDQHGRNVHIW